MHAMTPPDLAFCSVSELGVLLRSGEVTSAGLTDYFLDRLQTVGRRLNAVSAITADSARQEAALADAQLRRGLDRRPLHGIPYGLKDIIAVPGPPTTWGAVPFRDQVLSMRPRSPSGSATRERSCSASSPPSSWPAAWATPTPMPR